MRNIFIILICFFCVEGYSQPIVNRSNSNQTVQDARLKVQLNLFIPLYNDTTQANAGTNEGIDSSGALIYTRNPYAIWYRKNRQWIQLANGGGSNDAWLVEGNNPNAGSFVGTTFGSIDLVLRSNGLKMAELDGQNRIFRIGVLDTTVGGGTSFEVDDTDADTSRLTGLYKFNKLGFEIGGITYYMPSNNGTGSLYNPGNGFLTWNTPGGGGTISGIDSFTVSPTPPSLTTSICYWIEGAPVCYALAGDSSKILNDTLFQYFNGDSIPYPVVGDRIFFGNTAIINGNIFCSSIGGNDTCILISNNGQYADSIGLNADSTLYLLFNNGSQLGSGVSTLQKGIEGVDRILVRDTTGNNLAIYWDSTGFSSNTTLQQAWGNDSTASPNIYTRENVFTIRTARDAGYNQVILGGGDGSQLYSLSELGDNRVGALQATTEGNVILSSSIGAGASSAFNVEPTKSYLIRDNDTTLTKLGIGTFYPDSTLTVVGGIRLSGLYYNASSRYKMLIRDTVTGGLAYQNIPSGGSGDTSNVLTKTATQSVTGGTTFSNTSVGSANLIVTGGVQGGSDHIGLSVAGTYASTTDAHPVNISPVFSPASSAKSIAAVNVSLTTTGSQNMDHLVSYQGITTHNGTGTMQQLYGADFRVVNNGGRDTTAYGTYIADATGTGTVRNNYGLWIESMTKGYNQNYGLVLAGTGRNLLNKGISELQGNVIIGSTTDGATPAANLEIRKTTSGASFLMENNANDFMIRMYSTKTYATFRLLGGSTAYWYDDGKKTFTSSGRDSSSNSGLFVNQSFATAYRASGSSSVTLAEDITFNSDATTGNVTVNIPTAVGITGRIYVVRKSDASGNTVTLDPNGSETINGSTTVVLSSQYSFRMIQSDGANWMIISQL